MIASIRGQVLDVGTDVVVIEVGGLGLAVQCTPQAVSVLRRGDEATVHTSLVVREDSLTLYGFVDADERRVFEVLQTVSGVGPRLAQAMLATLRPDALRRIVATDDLAALTQVPGVGKKGAQRLVLELKDKLGAPTMSTSSAAAGSAATGPAAVGSWQVQVHAALVGLGWGHRDADTAVTAVAQEFGDDAPDAEIAVLLRSALQSMGSAVAGR